jgi:rfaE bifunctional protein kinase chain/domain
LASKKKKISKRSAARSVSSKPADASVDITRLLDLVAAFASQTIAVVGDFVLDEFVSGEISRVSREAPVLILRHRHTETYPGGAANAAINLADLGARVLPVGVVGDDEAGRALLDHFLKKRINISAIQRARDWTTTTKARYLAGWTHTTEQQVLRVDKEPRAAVSARIQIAVTRKAREVAKRADAVLISDYGVSAAWPGIAKTLNSKRLTLDSRYSLLEYRDTGVTAATPNESELEAAYHQRVGTNVQTLNDLGQRALRDLGLQALLVTRGNDGMAIFERGFQPRHIAIYGSDAPVDVTGAGDTVIAAFTLALAAGASCLEAAHLANYAGGIVVMKRRTAAVTRAELEAALRQEVTARR